jgi:hypothetical protein
MPVLIRHCITEEYVADGGLWTANPEKAAAFDGILKALEVVSARRLSGIRIVMRSIQGESVLEEPVGTR